MQSERRERGAASKVIFLLGGSTFTIIRRTIIHSVFYIFKFMNKKWSFQSTCDEYDTTLRRDKHGYTRIKHMMKKCDKIMTKKTFSLQSPCLFTNSLPKKTFSFEILN
jgi:hypothetical protein